MLERIFGAPKKVSEEEEPKNSKFSHLSHKVRALFIGVALTNFLTFTGNPFSVNSALAQSESDAAITTKTPESTEDLEKKYQALVEELYNKGRDSMEFVRVGEEKKPFVAGQLISSFGNQETVQRTLRLALEERVAANPSYNAVDEAATLALFKKEKERWQDTDTLKIAAVIQALQVEVDELRQAHNRKVTTTELATLSGDLDNIAGQQEHILIPEKPAMQARSVQALSALSPAKADLLRIFYGNATDLTDLQTEIIKRILSESNSSFLEQITVTIDSEDQTIVHPFFNLKPLAGAINAEVFGYNHSEMGQQRRADYLRTRIDPQCEPDRYAAAVAAEQTATKK